MSIRVPDLWRACIQPRRTLQNLQHWAALARGAELPYAKVMRARRELREDRGFQAHLERCRAAFGYVSPGPDLYVVVRAARPRVVVETGVASGWSSAHILRALEANGAGELHSIDLPNVQEGSVLPPGRAAGWMVPAELRGRWTLHLGDARTLLPEVLAALGRVDLFLHDSDHSYEHMSFELEQALPRLAAGGLLMSDDVHLHPAWDDFCAQHRLRPTRVERLGVTRNHPGAA